MSDPLEIGEAGGEQDSGPEDSWGVAFAAAMEAMGEQHEDEEVNVLGNEKGKHRPHHGQVGAVFLQDWARAGRAHHWAAKSEWSCYPLGH